MISDYLYRNPRILFLVIVVILVTGLTSFHLMPRREDPKLGRRVAVISTVFPGADAERVELLVTRPIEQRVQDLAEVAEIRSNSRAGISNVVLNLHDDVTETDEAWSRVRDRLIDVERELPDLSLRPQLEVFELQAFAAIISLSWNDSTNPEITTLRRLAVRLSDDLEELPGTDRVEIFGDPGEELLVEVDREWLSATRLTTSSIAQQIRSTHVDQPAGILRDRDTELLVDLEQLDDPVQWLNQIRIDVTATSRIPLEQIASVQRRAIRPPSTLNKSDGKRTITLGCYVRDKERLDHWSQRLQKELDSFQSGMPGQIGVNVIFSQSEFVNQRLSRLFISMLQAMAAVIGVVLLFLGWRSAIVVGASLPLSVLMVLAALRILEIPIHQMSVTGLIIALGLLIDNAIVVVDHVKLRRKRGDSPSAALVHCAKRLAMPLFGSTLTTALAFLPIATLPGPPGEFVGSIAVSVIAAISASFLLSMTVVPALQAVLGARETTANWFSDGISVRTVGVLYRSSLQLAFRYPIVGVSVGVLLPVVGYMQASRLPEQFFPSSDRAHIYLEIELPARASLTELNSLTDSIDGSLVSYKSIQRSHWFLGESAPTFYYNVVPRRRGTPFYAQAFVELKPDVEILPMVRLLQRDFNDQFPEARILVRQLEQGPPFDAPIEVRVQGPELAELERLGSELRLILGRIDEVTHTRADLQDTVPKIGLRVDPEVAGAVGINNDQLSGQLYTALEGADAGSFTTRAQRIPIRVCIAERDHLSIQQLASLELQASAIRRAPSETIGRQNNFVNRTSSEGGTPLGSLGELELTSDVAAVSRFNGIRTNEVKAYLEAGTLSAEVLSDFRQRLIDSEFELPTGYELSFGGESSERDQAVTSLMANAIVLFSLMLLTLVASFQSFRVAAIIAMVGALAIGLGPGALWLSGFPFGFMAIVGTMGLVGVAINDAIVVMAAIRADAEARAGRRKAMCLVVMDSTRHVLATTVTTIVGFAPLILGGGGFWPPMAITIAGGISGATLLALYFVPSAYLLVKFGKWSGHSPVAVSSVSATEKI